MRLRLALVLTLWLTADPLSSGAIKRAKLEKSEPTISYETFVEDLDRGDSFTTSLIEVLVKVRRARRCRGSHRGAKRSCRKWQSGVSAKMPQIVVSLQTRLRGFFAGFPILRLCIATVGSDVAQVAGGLRTP